MSINSKISMFYNAKSHLFEKAKSLREYMTVAELKLWEALKEKQIKNLRFSAQHPIDIFIADFYSHKLKLVLEIDGGYNNLSDQKEYDIGRDNELNNHGIQVEHFTNIEIENDISSVFNRIEKICKERYAMLQSPL